MPSLEIWQLDLTAIDNLNRFAAPPLRLAELPFKTAVRFIGEPRNAL
ncbi:hypothetical protein [Rhodoferax sp.]|nr:hypothetical protein [Rhodoferax sp.]MDO8318934.1 hypothetical protein [Rhodoferax sp.]MDP2680671.1 hypothetical protein [Rhodoferax sp.]